MTDSIICVQKEYELHHVINIVVYPDGSRRCMGNHYYVAHKGVIVWEHDEHHISLEDAIVALGSIATGETQIVI